MADPGFSVVALCSSESEILTRNFSGCFGSYLFLDLSVKSGGRGVDHHSSGSATEYYF